MATGEKNDIIMVPSTGPPTILLPSKDENALMPNTATANWLLAWGGIDVAMLKPNRSYKVTFVVKWNVDPHCHCDDVTIKILLVTPGNLVATPHDVPLKRVGTTLATSCSFTATGVGFVMYSMINLSGKAIDLTIDAIDFTDDSCTEEVTSTGTE